MWQAKVSKWAVYGIAAILLVLMFGWMLHSIRQGGFDDGAASVQADWDKQTLEYNAEVSRLKGVIAEKEKAHREENTRITHELSEANRKHEVELADARSDAADRLRLSAQRTAVYQRQASGGTAQCGSLASYASKLDAALEEGRALEREYRSTLGLRDQQIRSLSDQITNDRKLLNTDN